MTATTYQTVIKPQPRQAQFLSSSADICIFGSSAGVGKTYALLMEPLRHIHNPNFGCTIFRRTLAQVKKQGGLWDESHKLYGTFPSVISNKQDYTWTFNPNSRGMGAQVAFNQLQYDSTVEDYLSAQIALLAFDQLETFTRHQFVYMLHRNRSTCGIRPYIRATCNPDPDSFLAELLQWWIAEDGYADLSRCGIVRWLVIDGPKYIWADTRQELVDLYNDPDRPKSVTLIAGSIYDNPALLHADPGYLSNLKAQDEVTRERLLGHPTRGGNWKIRPSAGKVFNREWYKLTYDIPYGAEWVRSIDFAATEKSLRNDDPDFAATALQCKSGGLTTICDCDAFQESPATTEQNMIDMVLGDIPLVLKFNGNYRVRWEQEPGSMSILYSQTFTQKLRQAVTKHFPGFVLDCLGVPVNNQGDKFVRARAFAGDSRSGNVKLLSDESPHSQRQWNNRWLHHMHSQPAKHDDIMDTTVSGYNALASEGGVWVLGAE